MVVVEKIQSFVNDGTLHQVVKSQKYKIVPYIKFVSFDIQTGVLKLLMGGRNPECSTLHVRNVSNYLVCKDVLLPICKDKFTDVMIVVPVSTHDPNFESIVQECRYKFRMMNPDTCEDTMPASLSFRFLADKHPDITCRYKRENHKENLPCGISLMLFTEVKMRRMLQMTGIQWCVDDEFIMYSTNGELLDTVEKISGSINNGTFPPGLNLQFYQPLDWWVLYNNGNDSFKYYYVEEME